MQGVVCAGVLVRRFLVPAAVLATVALGVGAVSLCPVATEPTEWVWDGVRAAPVSGGRGQGIVGAGDHVYLVKCLDAGASPEVYRYDPVADRWTDASRDGLTMGVFRNGTALAWDGSSAIYALAGARAADTDRREFWRYRMDEGSWERLPDTLYAQGGGNALTWSAYDGALYAIVGSTHANHNDGRSYFLRYDPLAGAWSELPFDWAATGDGASLTWAGQYIYMLLGQIAERDPSGNRVFARFHIPSGTWEERSELPDPGGVGVGGSLLWLGASCPEVADHIFALGGEAADGTPGTGVYLYTIGTDSWVSLESLPCPVGFYGGPRLAFASGRIFYWQGERKAQPCDGTGFFQLPQDPPVCTYAIDPAGEEFPADGDSVTVRIDTQAACAWTAVSPCDWVTVNPKEGIGPRWVTVDVAENLVTEPRSCVLSLADQAFVVAQEPNPCTFEILFPRIRMHFPAEGRYTAVKVTTDEDCPWTAWSDCRWARVSTQVRTGTGWVGLRVRENTDTDPRSCTLHIADQTYEITQDGACSYAISPTRVRVEADRVQFSVRVTTQAGCPWTASSPCHWVSVSPTYGVGSGRVTVTVAANPGPDGRSCVLTIAGRRLYLVQDKP